jgi:hypothetical protein
MVSRQDYDKAALYLVATDRKLAQAIVRASRRHKPLSRELVLFEAALNDALRSTHVSREEADAGRLIEQAKPPRRKDTR